MPANSTPADKNIFNETYLSVNNRFEDIKRRIFKTCPDKVKKIIVMYECYFYDEMKTPGSPIHNFFKSSNLSIKSKKPQIMQPREALKGGSVQLFRVIARADENYEILALDINSLYPHVGIKNNFVCGRGIHLLGPKMLSRLQFDHHKKCFV